MIALGRVAGTGRLFQAQEQPERLLAERQEGQLDGRVGVRHRPWVGRQQVGGVEDRPAADRVEQVGRQREVDHLLDEDTADELYGVRVPLRVQGVEGCQIGGQRGVFDLDGPLQVPAQIVQRRDAGRRCGVERVGLVLRHGGLISVS